MCPLFIWMNDMWNWWAEKSGAIISQITKPLRKSQSHSTLNRLWLTDRQQDKPVDSWLSLKDWLTMREEQPQSVSSQNIYCGASIIILQSFILTKREIRFNYISPRKESVACVCTSFNPLHLFMTRPLVEWRQSRQVFIPVSGIKISIFLVLSLMAIRSGWGRINEIPSHGIVSTNKSSKPQIPRLLLLLLLLRMRRKKGYCASLPNNVNNKITLNFKCQSSLMN